MSALKGETLTLKSKGETVTIHWKQGSFFGVGGDKNQDYVLCDYALASGNHVPVYIQRRYDIPRSLTILIPDCSMECRRMSCSLFITIRNRNRFKSDSDAVTSMQPIIFSNLRKELHCDY